MLVFRWCLHDLSDLRDVVSSRIKTGLLLKNHGNSMNVYVNDWYWYCLILDNGRDKPIHA